MKRIFALILCVLVALSTSCIRGPQSDKRLRIVTTSVPLLSIVNYIINPEIAFAECILPVGTDGHDFDPSIRDINKATNSVGFVYCGDDLEAWALDIAKGAGGNSVKIDASVGVKLLFMDENDNEKSSEEAHEHEHGADPHLWTSPLNMLKLSENVHNALCEIKVETENGELIKIVNEDSYNALKNELNELDKRCKELAKLQDKTGMFLFFGDAFAFRYLMDEYDFEYISAFPGCSDEVEPSISRLAEVSAQIINNHAKFIFKAEMSNGDIAKSLAEQTGTQVLTLHSCHNISHEEKNNGDNYFSLMKNNLDAIEKAIQ